MLHTETTSFGAAINPILQPVIAYALDTPLTRIVLSRIPGQEAIDAWSAPQKDKRHTAYAAANCAVAYELLGNLGAAYAAAGQALEILSTLHSADDRQQAVNMRYYQEQLSERMAR